MISVIIPVYNAEKFIGRAIQSVMRQTYTDFELIVIDDGSTDNSLTEIGKAKRHNTTVITQANAGVGAARNAGMKYANGDLIFFLDADDYIMPHALQTLYNEYEITKAPITVGGAFKQMPAGDIIKNTAPISMGNFRTLLLSKNDISACVRAYLLTNDVYMVSHCWGRLYEKKFLDDHNIRFINTKVGEDGVFNITCLTIADEVAVINEPIYCFQMHNDSSSITAIKNDQHDLEPLQTALRTYLFNCNMDATAFRMLDCFIAKLKTAVKEFADKGVWQNDVVNYRMLTRKEVTIDKLQRSTFPIVICGADVVGREIYNICSFYNIEVAGFCDYNIAKVNFCNKPVCDSSDIPKEFLNAIFIISVLSIKDVVETLEEQAIDNWIPGGILFEGIDTEQFRPNYTIIEELYQTESCVIAHQAFMKKNYTFIRSLDVMITERCSLKCFDCSNLMQYFQHPRDISIDEVIRDLDNLLLNVDEIMEARILGGDAFMHPEWARIVEHATRQSKIRRVVVYTNGTIVPKDIDTLRHHKVIVVISHYSGLSKHIGELIAILKYNKIWHKVVQVDTWIDCARIHKNNRSVEENDNLFQDCVATNLTTMTDGKLFRCPYAASAYRLGIKEAGFDIASADGKTITAYLESKKAMDVCDYCDSRILGKKIPPALQVKDPRKFQEEALLTATEMPDVEVLKKILSEIEATIGRKIGSHIGARVGAQMGVQTWDIVAMDIWGEIVNRLPECREEAWELYSNACESIGKIKWGEFTDQARAQVCIYACYLIKGIFKLDYTHPAFDLIEMGVIVIRKDCGYWIYGKDGTIVGLLEIEKENE